ncbi:MAG: carboxypeptidase M32 [Deltaproteobacteria bacterium]|jgi:carboxypeptidase Taq|nr:carboxypeptidase M32 [Deltaproteobacteria bacterium]MBW2534494.1 carboxypeptidase M32 [Deltaproteobacteria bacterium]
MEAYRTLHSRFRRVTTLQNVEELLYWDTSVMMPSGATAGRADQAALLRVLHHEWLTAPDLADLLDAAEADASELDPWQQANLREMRRAQVHATAVPPDLVEALSRATSVGETTWREARPKSDFEAVRGLLEEVLSLVRQTAQAKAARLGGSAYDALLDEHEPGRKCADVDPLFRDLAEFLPPLLDDALEAQRSRPAPLPLEGPFPTERQEALGRRLMRQLGFDFQQGRLDVSAHPFCGGTPDDVRITTRYSEDDFAESLMATLHETGHGLYQRGLPAEWRDQPVGDARGAAIHESQSLLVEMQACRSRGFIEFLAPLLRETFGGSGPAWAPDNLVARYWRVEPTLIRVTADEVTYPAHVILRYRLERAMVDGELAIADLPGAWNDGMKELLRLEPPDHASGCMQDVHWFVGAWGYFPSYTLGAITAAQLFQKAVADDSTIEPALGKGDFRPLLGWLGAKIHSWGSYYEADELTLQATGSPLGLDAFQSHLTARYLP